MKEVFVIDFVRTALVKPLTSFANITSQDMAAACIADLINRTALPKDAVQDVVFGQSIITTFPYNLARHSAVLAGLSVETPGSTLQCLEASGLQALQNSYHLAMTGNSEIVIAGGAESYSAAPYVIRNARYNYDPEVNRVSDTITEVELYTQPEPMKKADLTQALAYKKGYSSEYQYSAAVNSFKKAAEAKQLEIWNKHITPIIIQDRKKGEFVCSEDMLLTENVPSITEYFGPINTDGACAMLLMTLEEAKQYNLKPIASIKGVACTACNPRESWFGAISAIEKLLARKSLSYADIDLFEIREDSGAAILAIKEALGQKASIEMDVIEGMINPYGGSLARGSCAGADGMILASSLILGLQHKEKKLGIAASSAAGGQGIAVLIELL